MALAMMNHSLKYNDIRHVTNNIPLFSLVEVVRDCVGFILVFTEANFYQLLW